MAHMIRCPNCGGYTGQKLHPMPLWVAVFIGIFPGMIIGLIFMIPFYIFDKIKAASDPYQQGNGYRCYVCQYKWLT
ncbi:MAG: hypothetical protein ACR2H5_17750 [Ktedonobacteraceae bacterium]